ncbi:hypothetical protein ACKFKF_25355 [Phormidesmis sp. 146-12]
MTHLLSSFLLSTSSNVDNFAVAVAYGVKKLKIGIFSNLLIAVVSALGTILSLSVGNVISRYLPGPVANVLGSSVLIVIGIIGIWDTLEREKKKAREKNRARKMTRSLVAAGIHSSDYSETYGDAAVMQSDTTLLDDIAYEGFLEDPAKADLDRSGHIDVKESIAIAFGLTINNLGSGVGAGISGLNIAITTILTFGCSILAIVVGYFLGDRLTAKMTGISAGVLSGLLMVILGVYEYFIP